MKPLLFNAFVMNTASHNHHGHWRRPDAGQVDFEDITLWIELAKTLERGRFDSMFFADVVGAYGPIGSDFETNIREGLQIPNGDPSVLLSAIAVATENLGLALTSSVIQAHPFEFARRISTLDHLSRGRIAWNIVTSGLDNSARNFGFDRLEPHDERYAWAEEYLDVVYKLWEGSWDEGGLLKDRERGVFSDPSKVHKINHVGARYRVEGPHLSSPSPQRTPLIFQAGSSPAGRMLAAANAEAQFINTPNVHVAAELIADTRRLAVEAGRRPGDVLFFQGLSFIVGSTEEEARQKEREYDEWANHEAYLLHASLGFDLDGKPYPLDTPLTEVETEGRQSVLTWLIQSRPGEVLTVRDLGAMASKRSTRIVGTPEQIADQLDGWRAAGVDGVNVITWVLPGTFDEFVDVVMPVLQQRGLAKREYEPGTLRQKLFGTDLLNERHPAARYRGAFSRQLA